MLSSLNSGLIKSIYTHDLEVNTVTLIFWLFGIFLAPMQGASIHYMYLVAALLAFFKLFLMKKHPSLYQDYEGFGSWIVFCIPVGSLKYMSQFIHTL